MSPPALFGLQYKHTGYLFYDASNCWLLQECWILHSRRPNSRSPLLTQPLATWPSYQPEFKVMTAVSTPSTKLLIAPAVLARIRIAQLVLLAIFSADTCHQSHLVLCSAAQTYRLYRPASNRNQQHNSFLHRVYLHDIIAFPLLIEYVSCLQMTMKNRPP